LCQYREKKKFNGGKEQRIIVNSKISFYLNGLASINVILDVLKVAFSETPNEVKDFENEERLSSCF
jgi:hypothetical protein